MSPVYGNQFIIPLVGGSGGAGGGDGREGETGLLRGGGGAGGGAILIATEGDMIIGTENGNGRIVSYGGELGGIGDNSSFWGGSGSGGAIRLLAPKIQGQGRIEADSPNSRPGGLGRIRIETNNFNEFTGRLDPEFGTEQTRVLPLLPSTIFHPEDTGETWPSIRVESINGVALQNERAYGFFLEMPPDFTIDTADIVPVVVSTENISTSASLKMTIFASQSSTTFEVQDLDYANGDENQATWNGTTIFPPGFSRGYIRATWD